MSKNMHLLILFLTINLLTNLHCYSQKIILNNSDTTICFSLTQAKFLLNQSYSLDEQRELLFLEKQTSLNQSKIIHTQEETISQYVGLYENQKALNALDGIKIDLLQDNLSKTNKELKKQKRLTFISLIGGLIVSTITTTLFITK